MFDMPLRPALKVLPMQDSVNIRLLLLKLRWMGLNEEADLLASESVRFAPHVTVAGCYETD